MHNHDHHLSQQQQQQQQRVIDDDDRRYCSSPYSFVDMECYSPYYYSRAEVTTMSPPPPPMMMNDDFPLPDTIANTRGVGNDDASISISISNSGSGDGNNVVNNSSSSSSCMKGKQIPDKERFLYILFDILSSTSLSSNQQEGGRGGGGASHDCFHHSSLLLNQPIPLQRTSNLLPANHPPTNLQILNDNNKEESISWLPHGQGFTILNKPIFESIILKRILPNVKYASFVKRLKRYKFVRISSGPEMGAYYHPHFRRDQPHLLSYINTTDDIPIERYGVDVNDVVIHGGGGGGGVSKQHHHGVSSNLNAAATGYCGGGGGGNAPIIHSSSSSSGCSSAYIDPPASNLDDFGPIAAVGGGATFSPIPEATGEGSSIHSTSLSLGTITPSSIQLTTTPSSFTNGGSSGRKTGKVVSLVAEELYADPTLFDDILLPFMGGEEDDDEEVIVIDDDDEDDRKGFISVRGGGGVDAVAPSPYAKSTGERNVVTEEESLKLLLPSENIFAVQHKMLQQEQMLQFERQKLMFQQQRVQLRLQQQQLQEQQLRLQQQQQQAVMQQPPLRTTQSNSAIITPITYKATLTTTAESYRHSNTAVKSDIVVAKDLKSFPQMLREISKAKRIESKKQTQNQPSSTTSFSRSTSSSSATNVINIPTVSMGGGPNMKNRFQYRRLGSAPDSVPLLHHTIMRENNNMREHQYRRRGSTDAIMARATGEKSNKYQYHRKDSADSTTFQRKSSSGSHTSYTMEDRSGKYRYRRNNSCNNATSSFTKTSSNRFQNHHNRNNTDVPRTTVPFEEQLRQQQLPKEEAQPSFVGMDWNGDRYRDERQRQQQQQHPPPHDEKLYRHRHGDRKNGGDPYAELWRQVDVGDGGFQYQSPEPDIATPVNNVPDDSLLDLDMGYSDYYKPHGGHHHDGNHQPQQQQQLLRLPQSPPASPLSQQNRHNDYQQIVETLAMGDDTCEQQIPLSPTMEYKHQQEYYGNCGGRVSEELSDDFDPFPLSLQEQFPSFRRRSTL